MMGFGMWPNYKPPEPKPAVHPNCFLCGLPATERKSTVMYCQRHPEGEVRWSAYEANVQELRDEISWYGKTLIFTDHTQPDSPGSPA